MRTYVSTIGHHSTRVLRPLLSNGIDAGDAIVLLRPENDASEQAEAAITDIEQTVQKIAPRTTVAVEKISYEEFALAVLECVDILEAADGTVIVNFDGGLREVFLPFTVAAIARSELIDTVFQFRDIDKKVCELALPNIVSRAPSATDETLQAVADLGTEATLPAIAEMTGKSRSTTGRHLDSLREAGAIQTTKRGKTRHAELTLGGRLRL